MAQYLAYAYRWLNNVVIMFRWLNIVIMLTGGTYVVIVLIVDSIMSYLCL